MCSNSCVLNDKKLVYIQKVKRVQSKLLEYGEKAKISTCILEALRGGFRGPPYYYLQNFFRALNLPLSQHFSSYIDQMSIACVCNC